MSRRICCTQQQLRYVFPKRIQPLHCRGLQESCRSPLSPADRSAQWDDNTLPQHKGLAQQTKCGVVGSLLDILVPSLLLDLPWAVTPAPNLSQLRTYTCQSFSTTGARFDLPGVKRYENSHLHSHRGAAERQQWPWNRRESRALASGTRPLSEPTFCLQTSSKSIPGICECSFPQIRTPGFR